MAVLTWSSWGSALHPDHDSTGCIILPPNVRSRMTGQILTVQRRVLTFVRPTQSCFLDRERYVGNMPQPDRRVLKLARDFVARGQNKRACFVLRRILETGRCTTDDLSEAGYEHAPRAAADVRDQGIPLVTGSEQSRKTGRRMAVYTLGSRDDIQEGRIGGRSAFPKTFKAELIAHYGSVDCITGATLDPKVLQVDHRVPFRVAGDGEGERRVEDYMLLDGSSQRAKSWSCEHCPNLLSSLDPRICGTCFWAHPERYNHIATEPYRRVDVSWQGSDVEIYDRMRKDGAARGIGPAESLRRLAREAFRKKS